MQTNTAFVDSLPGHNLLTRQWKATHDTPFMRTWIASDAQGVSTFWLIPCNAIEEQYTHTMPVELGWDASRPLPEEMIS